MDRRDDGNKSLFDELGRIMAALSPEPHCCGGVAISFDPMPIQFFEIVEHSRFVGLAHAHRQQQTQ